MMWIDVRKPNVHLLRACVEISAPAIELLTASSSISAVLFGSAAGPRVGAVGWVMGGHCVAPSQPHRSGEEASATGGPQGRRIEGKREGSKEWRRIERTLGITGAWIDLTVQSIRWGLYV